MTTPKSPRDRRDERSLGSPADPRDERVIPIDPRDERELNDPRDERRSSDLLDTEPAHTISSRLRVALHQRPYTMTFAVVLIIPGILAIIYGDDVSQALSNISAGILSRFMGAAILLGCIVTLEGIARGKHLTECTGLSLMAAGCIVYGLGVILGLGLAGMVAGPGFIAIALGSLMRIKGLTTAASAIDKKDEC